MKKFTSMFAAMLAIAAVAVSCQDKPEPEPVVPGVSEVPFINGNDVVTVTSTAIEEGDVVKLVAVAGTEYETTIPVANITEKSFDIELPADLIKTRSYKMTVSRGEEVLFDGYLHPDDNYCTLPYILGYIMTGSNEVVEDDPNFKNAPRNAEVYQRMGYLNGKIFDYNPETKEWKLWKGDVDLEPFTANQLYFGDYQLYGEGVTTLSMMKGIVDFGSVTGNVFIPNCQLEDIDMTMFPNATRLYCWGDGGNNCANVKKVNFGTPGKDPELSLNYINLKNQSIEGELDLRNCVQLNDDNDGTWLSAEFCNNQITSVNLGVAGTDTPLPIKGIDLRNNQIKSIDIANCYQLRALMLEGNSINNANFQMLVGQKWVYILKDPYHFNVTWDPNGGTINAEAYWWRVMSESNIKEVRGELGDHAAQAEDYITTWADWTWPRTDDLKPNPIVAALGQGNFTVNCYYEAGEATGPDSSNPLWAGSHTDLSGDPCYASGWAKH